MSSDTPASPADAPLPVNGPDGRRPDLRVLVSTIGQDGHLTDESARFMLDKCVTFLTQLVILTGHVINTVDVGNMRKVVAADLATSGDVIDNEGRISKSARPPIEPEQGRGKGPRGSRHPLMVLIAHAKDACKLIRKILEGTNPDVLGKLSELDRFEADLTAIYARRGGKVAPEEKYP